MKTLYFRVPDVLHARFTAEAERQQTTLSALGIRALHEWLDKAEQQAAETPIASNRGRWNL